MRAASDFKGIHVALVTCFHPGTGEYDEEAQKKLVEYVILEQKADGVVVCATTGEFANLTEEEYQKAALTVLKTARALNDKGLVILGTTSMSFDVSLNRNRWAYEQGFDGVLMSYPPYLKPDQRGMLSYFKEIARHEPDLPIILYNIWYRTGGPGMNAETIIELSKVNNIVGIKDCGVSVEHMDEVIQKTNPKEFVYLSGEDAVLFDVLSHGGQGGIFAAAHLVGLEMKKMMVDFENKDIDKALQAHRKIKPLVKAIFLEPNPAPLKFALSLKGFSVGDPRGPTLLPVTQKTQSIIQEELSCYDGK